MAGIPSFLCQSKKIVWLAEIFSIYLLIIFQTCIILGADGESWTLTKYEEDKNHEIQPHV